MDRDKIVILLYVLGSGLFFAFSVLAFLGYFD